MTPEISHIEQLVADSRYFEAHHAIESSLDATPGTERLEQLKALVLSKMGDPQVALEFFESRWRSHANSSESAGIMGSIYKSIFIATKDPKYGKLSANTYLESFNLTKSYYTGINAATMSRIVGNSMAAKSIAKEIEAILLPMDRDFWEEATLAECYLLLKNHNKATEHYIRTREMMSSNWGSINSVHQQLWLLNHYTHVPKNILEFFKPPKITAFIGHMIDAPTREKPRFAPGMENNVRAAIRSSIMTYNIQIGYSSLACGSDVIFVEEMLDLGRNVQLIFPFNITDFIQTSVAFAGDHWVDRFYAILERDIPIHYLVDEPFSGDDYQFHLLALQISGLAMLKAQQMRSETHLLAVLSEFDLEAKTGGVRDLVNFWEEKDKIHKVNIDIFSNNNDQTETPSFEYFKNQNFDNKGASVFIITLEVQESEIIEAVLAARTPIFHEMANGKTVIAFQHFPVVTGFISDFLQEVKRTSFKGSIVLGNPRQEAENIFDSTAVKQGAILSNADADNVFLINEAIASLMITSMPSLQFQYVGNMELLEGEKEIIYRMS